MIYLVPLSPSFNICKVMQDAAVIEAAVFALRHATMDRAASGTDAVAFRESGGACALISAVNTHAANANIVVHGLRCVRNLSRDRMFNDALVNFASTVEAQCRAECKGILPCRCNNFGHSLAAAAFS